VINDDCVAPTGGMRAAAAIVHRPSGPGDIVE
jgi:hypothetical protein